MVTYSQVVGWITRFMQVGTLVMAYWLVIGRAGALAGLVVGLLITLPLTLYHRKLSKKDTNSTAP